MSSYLSGDEIDLLETLIHCSGSLQRGPPDADTGVSFNYRGTPRPMRAIVYYDVPRAAEKSALDKGLVHRGDSAMHITDAGRLELAATNKA